VGLSFLAIAAWALVPDQADEDAVPGARYGVFLVTLVAFFLAEFGDKTQVATLMLAAKYDAMVAVVAGSTLGMLCADVPAVLLASAAPRAIPLKVVRFAAAALFGALGVAALVS
jgi:putative Ca2+/H+ antiporter (TMEM165/GDT1 family)